jgi:hypothetical protein
VDTNTRQETSTDNLPAIFVSVGATHFNAPLYLYLPDLGPEGPCLQAWEGMVPCREAIVRHSTCEPLVVRTGDEPVWGGLWARAAPAHPQVRGVARSTLSWRQTVAVLLEVPRLEAIGGFGTGRPVVPADTRQGARPRSRDRAAPWLEPGGVSHLPASGGTHTPLVKSLRPDSAPRSSPLLLWLSPLSPPPPCGVLCRMIVAAAIQGRRVK